MEQDVKVGTVGSATITESAVEEKAALQAKVGPVSIQLSVAIENADLVALLASKMPAGFAHDAVVMIAKELGVALPEAAPAAAPSA